MASKKATKKASTSTRRVREGRQQQKTADRGSFFDYFKLTESYASLLLGLVVVIIAAILVVSFVRNRAADTNNTANQNISATQTQDENQAAQGNPQPGSTYVVKAGDDLWKIAEVAYKDGYKWTDIARANNISDPGMISEGQRISIPESATASAEVVSPTPTTVAPTQQQVSPTAAQAQEAPTQGQETPQQSPIGQQIAGASYTVAHGDYLWVIAERAYGDGHKWVEIARANNLVNPDVIHTGNVLRLPR